MTAVVRHVVEFRAELVAHALGADADDAPSCPKWIPERVWHLAQELQALSNVLDALERNPKRDLNRVVDEFLYWLLSDELKDYETSKPVAELYRRRLAGDEPSQKEWKAARAAAEGAEAAAAAAWAAAWARAAAWACRQRMHDKFVSLLGAGL